MRLLSQPEIGTGMRSYDLTERLRRFCLSGFHSFWPDVVSLRDASLFNQSYICSHRQITDVYLLGLAVKMGGRLATCDRAVPLRSVLGATRAHLATVEPAEE